MTESPPRRAGSDGTAGRRSPLHAWHESHGARFVDRHGWRVPASYGDMSGAVAAARTGLALADVTAFAKYLVTGKDVAALARARMEDPQPGKMIPVKEPRPGWLCYLSEDTLLFLCHELTPSRNELTPWRDVTDAYAGFLLIGSDAPQALGTHLNLGASPNVLAPGTCLETGFYGAACVLARPAHERPNVVGIWVSCDVALYAWERLAEAGNPVPLGLDTLKELRWRA